jgi:DNA polymerase-3 subunit delta
VLASELEKLARYAEGRAIAVADVDLLTPEAREETIFEIVDAAVEGRAADALLNMRRNLEHGSDTPLRFLAMIARQLRGMVRAAELLEAGASPDEIASATRLAAGSYPLRKLTGQARTAGLQASEDGLRAVEAADHAIKTGRLTDLLALELLVLQLAGLMRDRAPARAPRRGR